MEKFAVAKADRFLAQGNQLVLPALELIYVWNGFKILGKSWEMMEPVFLLVEKCLKDIELEKGIMRQLFVTMTHCSKFSRYQWIYYPAVFPPDLGLKLLENT